MRTWAYVALFVPAAAVAANCALGGFERGGGGTTTTSSSSGGSGGSGGQGGAPPDNCHAGFPPPPAVTNAGGDIEFTVAMRTVALDEQVDGGPLGVDLDKTCTCQLEGPSCVHAADADVCDLPRGRDNVSGKLNQLIELALGGADLSQTFSDGAETGQWSLLLRVSGYNGELDDDHVVLAWYVASGWHAIHPPASVPIWDGTDVWPVSATSVAPGPDGGPDIDSPLYGDPGAYVTGGVLVASLPSSEIVLAGSVSTMTLRFAAGGLMARLVGQGNQWAMRDGVAAARINGSDLFAAVSSFRDDSAQPLCTDSLGYPFAKQALCGALDILTNVGGPTKPCDALSWAVGFSADPAEIGPVVAPPAPTPGCDPSLDPANDTCGGGGPGGAGGAGGAG